VLLQVLESCALNLLQLPQFFIPPLFLQSFRFVDFALYPVRTSGDRRTVQRADELVKQVFDPLHSTIRPVLATIACATFFDAEYKLTIWMVREFLPTVHP